MKLGKIDLTLTGAIDCLTNISSADSIPDDELGFRVRRYIRSLMLRKTPN
jgi:hypothetical protein